MNECEFRETMEVVSKTIKLVYELYPQLEKNPRRPHVVDSTTKEWRRMGLKLAFQQIRQCLSLRWFALGSPVHEDDVTRDMGEWPYRRVLEHCAAKVRAAAGLPPTPATVGDARGAMRLIRINAPEWFKDADFVAWLNAPGTATWHTKGEEPSEGSDVFFTWCQGVEGSDWPGTTEHPGIPDRIWNELGHLIQDSVFPRVFSEALIWVSNLDEGYDVQPLTKDD